MLDVGGGFPESLSFLPELRVRYVSAALAELFAADGNTPHTRRLVLELSFPPESAENSSSTPLVEITRLQHEGWFERTPPAGPQ